MIDIETRQRRRNAARLQEYLRRQSPSGFTEDPDELLAVARDIGHELCGGPSIMEVIRQAWADLTLMGLIIPDPSPDGGGTWRLADSPSSRRRSEMTLAGSGGGR